MNFKTGKKRKFRKNSIEKILSLIQSKKIIFFSYKKYISGNKYSSYLDYKYS